jgi:membrane-associated protein
LPTSLALPLTDPAALLTTFGTLGVFLVTFAETGLLIGFFLPGDSLLFTAGVLAATTSGSALLRRTENRHVHNGVEHSARVLERYGHGKAIVLARFIPVVRTVLNPLAGITGIPARVFLLWQAIGGLLWTVGVTLAGYLLGSSIPNIDQYLLPVIAGIVVVSLIPVARQIYLARKQVPDDRR